jgi:phage terminase large subunit-like protein
VLGLVEQGAVASFWDDKADPDNTGTKGCWGYHIYFDPYQMHQVAKRLWKEHGILCYEFPQGKERTLSDTFMYKCYRDGLIDNVDSPDLEHHLANSKARELEGELIRIVKGTTSNAGKVDAAVAQGMALYRCSQNEEEQPSLNVMVQASVEDGWGVS